jgi:D-glycero-D-manno-heptose 1,7-bisphosphate phosphatase
MGTEPAPAAFIDRDGVINADLGHVHRVRDFRFVPNAVAGLRLLADSGFRLIVVTNQAGIAKGMYTEADYELLTRHMTAALEAEGVRLAGVYYCPHHPQGVIERYAIHCACRKPAPGMLLLAAQELGLNLPGSIMIGDKISDAAAGRAAGVARTVLVESGHRLPADSRSHADHQAPDLLAAASWIAVRSTHN